MRWVENYTIIRLNVRKAIILKRKIELKDVSMCGVINLVANALFIPDFQYMIWCH